MSESEIVLSVSGLRKVFGSQVAVDDMNFELPAGKSLAIVGESGSGKTTVARMIAGLEKATAGTIIACGRDRSKPSRNGAERKLRGREVQIVFQDPYSSLDPRQTGADLVDEVLRVHHGGDPAERAKRVAELAALVGLDQRQMNAMPKALSGGQRQIGRAHV